MTSPRRSSKPVARKGRARSSVERAPLNLTLRKTIVARARQLELNISEIADRALEQAVKDAERQRWADDNKAAFDYMNRWVEEHGIFGEEWRRF